MIGFMTMTFTPAEVADRTGFSLDTLRYYEREGILSPIARTAGGQRAYSPNDVAWLELVRCLRDTGMPIAQLKRYSELAVDPATLDERLALLEAHAVEVQASIDTLLAQQQRLHEKIAWYHDMGAGGSN